MRTRGKNAAATLGLVLMGLAMSSCGLGGFDPQSKITSVRILASRADKPYARPGETVTIDLLAVDGRRDRSRPMNVWWVPQVCINPPDDLYYLCFSSLVGGAGGEGGAGAIQPGMDLTPFLIPGTTFSFTLPPDIITNHPPVPGVAAPYGLAIVFNIACAGHVELLPPDPNNRSPQVMPIGCFDDEGNQLGPDDYVFGFTRIYAYDERTNANPIIEGIRVDGQPVDPAVGITVERCTAKKRADCQAHPIEVIVPETSQEPNPGEIDSRGEQVWATLYTTSGQLDSDATLLYDSKRGKITENEVEFRAPSQPEDGTIFVVVHDNRNGAAWVQFPVHTR